jgi:anhydro-N-acetylmuramic acid kinase
MSAIQRLLPGSLKLVTSDKYGVPPQFKEAVKFAVLGFAALNGIANNIPAASHAAHYAVMGKIAIAPRHAVAAGRLQNDQWNW